jgi:hypothetical protein
MIPKLSVVLVASLCTATVTLARGDRDRAADTPTTAADVAFARLATLAGDWEARAPALYANATIRLNYRLISDDSVMMETFRIDEQGVEMVTMYHLDGDRLVLTHYCAVNNQVGMRADVTNVGKQPADVKTLTFAITDARNIQRSHRQVMDRLQLQLHDETHLTQTWHWRDEKRPSGTDSAVYRFTRVR